MTNPNNSPTDNWLIGSAQPMSESEWNDQRARAAADQARGITFGGGGSGSSQLQSNTASQDYTGETPAATENQQGYHYVVPRELNTRTYAGYNAWMTNPNRSLIDNWLIGGAKPMSEAEWNAQNGRAAADAARGVTFGGGEVPPPTSAQINAELNSLPKNQNALDNWFRTNSYTPEQMAAATGYSVADILNASNLAFSKLNEPTQTEAPVQQNVSTGVPGAPVGSFCAPWGNTVTWDYTGAQTDTYSPCQ